MTVIQAMAGEERSLRAITLPKSSAFVPAPQNGSFDAVIAGGGPAGMTCALYLMRKMVNTLMITPELGGQVRWTSEIENYPGYMVISGIELAEKYREQLEKYPLTIRMGERIVAMESHGLGGLVRTEHGSEYAFKGLVIATGKHSQKLDVPGMDAFLGRGVTYCATCDGPLYRGEEVAVIGGGNSALSAAIDLLNLDCTVHLVNNVPELQAEAVLVEKVLDRDRAIYHPNSEVAEICGDNVVTGITIRNLADGVVEKIPVKGVFIEIGLIPNSQFAEGVVEMNADREIIVDCRCQTDVPGIYAAGDVTNVPNKQIIIAAGEGAKSALSVSEFLKKLR